MTVPEGRLLRSRVVEDPREVLESALDRELTGYAVLEPQDALLLGGDDAGRITFREGVPRTAYHAGSGRGGPPALADLAVPGPYSLELHELGADRLAAVESDDHRVPPDMPAERLAGDPDLAARTREVAPDSRLSDPPVQGPTDTPDVPEGDHEPAGGTDADAVATFLDDDEKIEAIRKQARRQARERAEEWGLDDQLETQ